MVSASVAPLLGRRLLLVVLVAVVPLGALGLWATQGASRSGRALRRTQLNEQLDATVREVALTWAGYRSELLTIGESEPVRRELVAEPSGSEIPPFVQRAFAQMGAFDRITIRDRAGRTRFTLVSALASSELSPSTRKGMPSLTAAVPLTDLSTGDTIGTAEAAVRLVALLPSIARPVVKGGPILQLLLPGDIRVWQAESDPRVFDDERFVLDGERWTTVRRELFAPSLDVMMAGTLSTFEAPFEQSARRNLLVLLVTTGVIAVIIMWLTRRLTRDVERELAQREALAAVGEFASELAHEVRNPLTAMRLDVQRAQEQVNEPIAVGAILPRVLGQIDRLDRAVSGALRVARSGSIEPEPVDLAAVLEAARRSAEPEFERRRARLTMHEVTSGRLLLDGDADALEQLFLNLLINAAQALSPAGEANVSARGAVGAIVVTVADTGKGMTAEQLARSAQPLHSSRRDGTGLGLKIARRIVASHGGTMSFESVAGEGTTVVVRLPLKNGTM